MKEDRKINLNRILSSRLVIGIAALSVTLYLWAVFGVVNFQTLRLTVNQIQWKASKPSAYYIRVVELRPDGDPRRWAAYVQNSHPIRVTGNRYPEDASLLNPANLAIEQIFNLSNRSCATRGVINCWIEFDPQYHYPQLVDSYEMFIIEIEEFTPCGQSVADCPLQAETSP